MTIRERIRALKAEAAQLETAATEEERASAYLAALREERRGALQNLERARRLGEASEDYVPWPGMTAKRTGLEVVAEEEAHLECIDWELRRIGASS